MGVLTLIVFCVLISFVTANNASDEHESSSTLINIRLKRETEIDSKVGLIKPAIPICRTPTKIIIPVKLKNTLNTPIIKPKRRLIPIVINKPKILQLNTSTEKLDTSRADNDELNHENEKKTERESPESEVIQIEENRIVETTNDKSDDIVAKSSEPKVKKIVDEPKLSTLEKSQDTKIENKETNDTTNTSDGNLEPDTTIKSDEIYPVEEKASKVEKEESELQVKEITPTLETLTVKKPLNNIFPAYKIVPGIPFERRNTPVLNNSLEISTNNTTLNKIPSKVDPLTIIADKKLTSLVAEPTPKVNSAEDKTNLDKTKENASNSKNAELEEIIIENNKFEELYENFNPTQKPKILTSDLQPPAWSDFNQAPIFPTYQKTYDEVSKPYPYSITKYPGQYVVKPIYESEYPFDTRKTIKDTDNGISNSYEYKPKINNAWYQNYNRNYQPQSQNFGQTSFENYNQSPQLIEQSNYDNQYQTYPSRIWRAWQNNNVYIRPRNGNITALYKGLGNYLSNDNVKMSRYNQNIRPAYSYYGHNFTPRVNMYQNTSPANPFHRYGYYDKNNI